MAEPGLFGSSWCVGASCSVSAAVCGCLKHCWGPPSSFLPCCGCLWFFKIISENEIDATRVPFPRCPWNSRKMSDSLTRDLKKNVAMHPRVAVMLVLLHILGNRLIWRRQQRPIAVVSVCSGTESFREILNSPSYACVNKWASSYGEWTVGTLGASFSEDVVPFRGKNEMSEDDKIVSKLSVPSGQAIAN